MIFEYNMKAKADTVAWEMMSMTDNIVYSPRRHEEDIKLRVFVVNTLFVKNFWLSTYSVSERRRGIIAEKPKPCF